MVLIAEVEDTVSDTGNCLTTMISRKEYCGTARQGQITFPVEAVWCLDVSLQVQFSLQGQTKPHCGSGIRSIFEVSLAQEGDTLNKPSFWMARRPRRTGRLSLLHQLLQPQHCVLTVRLRESATSHRCAQLPGRALFRLPGGRSRRALGRALLPQQAVGFPGHVEDQPCFGLPANEAVRFVQRAPFLTFSLRQPLKPRCFCFTICPRLSTSPCIALALGHLTCGTPLSPQQDHPKLSGPTVELGPNPQRAWPCTIVDKGCIRFLQRLRCLGTPIGNIMKVAP